MKSEKSGISEKVGEKKYRITKKKQENNNKKKIKRNELVKKYKIRKCRKSEKVGNWKKYGI